jgi:hypothetical protein
MLDWTFGENKPNSKPKCRPSAGNPKIEALNPKQRYVKEYSLKKQSQFYKIGDECKYL